MIKPTVGRKAWYRPSPNDVLGPMPMLYSPDQPLDATIIYVWGDRTVNVLVTDMYGKQFPVSSCTLVQEGDPKPDGRYVEWMPYQQGQAKAAESSHPSTVTPSADDVAALKRAAAEAKGLPSLEEELAKADKAGNA